MTQRSSSPRIPLPAPLAGQPFSVGEARQNGIGEGRLRGTDLARPFWGVRGPAIAGGFTELCHAYLTRARPSAFFSHVTAARLLGIRLPFRLLESDVLDVAVPAPKRAQQARGIRGHKLRLRPGDLTVRDGMAMTSPVRTWCDIAGLLNDEELLAAGDTLLWWRNPLTYPAEIARAVANHRGAARSALHRTVSELSARADSSPESSFRHRFALAGLPRPEVNLQLYDAQGNKVAMPDLCFPEFTESFDYEGDHHRTDPRTWQSDIQRVRRLAKIGYHHTRAAAADLADSREILDQLRTDLRAKGWAG
ncbi:hypothetical protein [Conyzicola sp.]|uniref:hypothetical protein n=1 Tax=Conyzicola sp. TaxID=1969404 RepID=UPI003989EC66